MVRSEFDVVWKAEKSIIQDIIFAPAPGYANSVSVNDIEVLGSGFDGLSVNMTYECDFKSLICNFTIKGVGAIHRYCLGATIHGTAGRFHQHHIVHGDCVRRQLPFVTPREDLRAMTTEAIWTTVCQEANIAFVGTFFPPEAVCK